MTTLLAPILKKHLLLIGIFCIGFFTYAPSLGNELFWDDEQFIYNNQYVKQFDVQKIFTTNTIAGAGEISNYYRPLTTLSFAIDHAIWGMLPFGFHLTNTILHSCAGVLLFLLLKTLGMSKKTAAVIAVFFLIHPLQAQSVAYVNARGDSYYTFYTLLGLLSFSQLLQNKKHTVKIYNLSHTFGHVFFASVTPLFFIASILAKEIALGSLTLYVLVFALLLTTTLKEKTQKIGVFVLGTLAALAAAYVLSRTTILLFQEQTNLFAGTPYGDSVLVRMATFAKVFLIYISLIIAPLGLHMERTTTVITSLFSPYTFFSLAIVLAVAGIGILEYQKKKTRWIHFGLGWFLGMLVPVSGIIPLNDIIYEHWLYAPKIGFFILIYGLFSLFFTLANRPWPKQTTNLLICVAILHIVLTLRQNYLWAKPTRFYPYILQFSETARIHNNLAMAYADEGKYDAAISHYIQAIEIHDFYPQTHHNLARTYLAVGDTQKAIDAFTTAVTMSPDFLVSYPQLIQLHLEKGEVETAETYLEKLVESIPNSPVLKQLTALLESTKKNLQIQSEISD